MPERSRSFSATPPMFLENTVVDIDVPSGRLIASDELRSVGHFNVEQPMSLMHGYGMDALAKRLAEVNVAYAFTGNSSPSVTRRTDGLIQVVTPAWSPEKVTFNDDEVVVGKICTDHWATMLTDYQHWLDHGGPEVAVANSRYALTKFTVINVTPGKYRWTVYSHSDHFDGDHPDRVTYAQLELVEAY
jgi:hypothetical protein